MAAKIYNDKGGYSFVKRNCQHFAEDLALIIVEEDPNKRLTLLDTLLLTRERERERCLLFVYPQ